MAEQTQAKEVLTVIGLLNWAFLVTPFVSKKYPTQGPKFKTQVLLDPTDPQIPEIKASQRRVATAVWGTAPATWTDPMSGAVSQVPAFQLKLLELQMANKLVLRDGNRQTGEQADENAKGKLFIQTSHKNQPTIVATIGRENVKLQPGHALFPYSGCKAAVMFELYAYKKESLVCQLMGVQFLGHGKAFGNVGQGGRLARADEFGINPCDADAAIPMTQADVGSAGLI